MSRGSHWASDGSSGAIVRVMRDASGRLFRAGEG
jgi:hypothetical protein